MLKYVKLTFKALKIFFIWTLELIRNLFSDFKLPFSMYPENLYLPSIIMYILLSNGPQLSLNLSISGGQWSNKLKSSKLGMTDTYLLEGLLYLMFRYLPAPVVPKTSRNSPSLHHFWRTRELNTLPAPQRAGTYSKTGLIACFDVKNASSYVVWDWLTKPLRVPLVPQSFE